jgi:hypothetical protein
VKISIKSERIITLDFFTHIQAQQALIELQTQIDTLITNVPFIISQDLENYIQQVTSSIDYNWLLNKPFLNENGKVTTNKDVILDSNLQFSHGGLTYGQISGGSNSSNYLQFQVVGTSSVNTWSLQDGNLILPSDIGDIKRWSKCFKCLSWNFINTSSSQTNR